MEHSGLGLHLYELCLFACILFENKWENIDLPVQGYLLIAW